jgi:ATP10 protein
LLQQTSQPHLLLGWEAMADGMFVKVAGFNRVVPRAAIRFSICAAAICVFVPVCAAQRIPATQAKTLDGSSVRFPDATSGKSLLLVVGFSHQSSGPCQAWDKRLAPLYLDSTRVLYYEAADFQGVPSLIMKMILHGMKKEIPANEHSHFVLLQENEEQWKSAAQFSAANEPYILLTDPAGHIVWKAHGAVTDEQFAALQAAIRTQLGN